MNSCWSYGPETLNSGQNMWFFVPCDLEIWWMTLKNNRAPLLSNLKLCASFHRHVWTQTGVTVWKMLNWVLRCVSGNNSWNFHDDTTGTLWKGCHRRTDRSVLRATWSQLKIREGDKQTLREHHIYFPSLSFDMVITVPCVQSRAIWLSSPHLNHCLPTS